MARLVCPQFRLATPADAESVAALHTDSWRRHYRGAYTDAFLDGDVGTDRLTVWSDRLQKPDPRQRTILAEDNGDLVGFAHTLLDDDPTWGALLDNLHVVFGKKRQRVGSRLLTLTAQAVTEQANRTGLYLWVLEQNTDAQAFYEKHGATCVGSRPVLGPGGVPARVNGSPVALRYAWPDPVERSYGEP